MNQLYMYITRAAKTLEGAQVRNIFNHSYVHVHTPIPYYNYTMCYFKTTGLVTTVHASDQ